MVLEIAVEFHEAGRPPPDANDQLLIAFGVFPHVLHGVEVDGVELQLMTAAIHKKVLDQAGERLET